MTFPVNIIQGPLAGVSCAPFRRLTWQYSHPAFSCTEMISCKTILHQPLEAQQRFVKKDPQEGAVCFQLAANNPYELAEATKRVTAYGADLIDLNCGCPVKKIRSKGAGSSLLIKPQLLYQLMKAMKDNTHVPVSIKIRVPKEEHEVFHKDIVNAVKDAGIDCLIVHGRHWTEHYETPCRHDAITYFVNELDIPIIGNGDIACVDSLKTMLNTGCAGVMIGRAGVGQPWLIQQLMSEMKNENFVRPSNELIMSAFLEHVTGLIELLQSEKFAILQARKFAKYYARHLSSRSEFAAAVNACDSFESLKMICRDFFHTTCPAAQPDDQAH